VTYEVTPVYTGRIATPGRNVHPLETRFARRLDWSYQLKKENESGTGLVNDTAPVEQIAARGSGTVPSISDGYPD
ncbi:MAG: hypothetical protein HW398_995, partial [Acidobacteria bacterium]|nr:hypothetical protein [Acidobacteriota bacterium]